VSGAGAAGFPLPAQTYFCDSRSPFRSPLRDLPLPIRFRDYFYISSWLRSRSVLTRFSARSAPLRFLLRSRSNVSIRKPGCVSKIKLTVGRATGNSVLKAKITPRLVTKFPKIPGHPLHVFGLQTRRKWGKGHILVGDEVKENHSIREITVC